MGRRRVRSGEARAATTVKERLEEAAGIDERLGFREKDAAAGGWGVRRRGLAGLPGRSAGWALCLSSTT